MLFRSLLVGGVGGTGVITVGALIIMAAHLEAKGASVLDFMGFAQKGGTVLSYVRLAPRPQDIHQVRIDVGQADALVACDMVVGTSDKALSVLLRGHSRAVLNLAQMPTADNVLYRDADMQATRRVRVLEDALGEGQLDTLDANRLAEALLGDTVFSNVMMLGFAWQRGLIPVSLAALDRAIELNGVAVEKNRTAFNWGRLAVVEREFVEQSAGGETIVEVVDLEALIERNIEFLTQYQNAAYAKRYQAAVAAVARVEQGNNSSKALTEAVARQLFRVMAYKDEYEVARLYTETDFLQEVSENFCGDYRIRFHLAPPILARKPGNDGRPAKISLGPWVLRPLQLLAKMRGLRGTALDLFGYSTDRKLERHLLSNYEKLIEELVSGLEGKQFTEQRHATAIELAQLPQEVRGFGIVKEQAVAKMELRQAQLLTEFRAQEAPMEQDKRGCYV